MSLLLPVVIDSNELTLKLITSSQIYAALPGLSMRLHGRSVDKKLCAAQGVPEQFMFTQRPILRRLLLVAVLQPLGLLMIS